MTYTFDSLLRKIGANHSKKKLDRNVDRNTYVRISDGDRENPLAVSIKLHNTDILTFYKDGSTMVDCNYTSHTTNDRLWRYSNQQYRFGIHILPAINGFRPVPTKCAVLWFADRCVKAAGRVCFMPDGSLVEASARPLELEYVNNPKLVRQASLRIGKILSQIKIRRKLGAFGVIPPRPGMSLTHRDEFEAQQWLLAHEDVPLESIPWDDVPRALQLVDADREGLPYLLAKKIDVLSTTTFIEIPTKPLAIPQQQA